MVKSEVERLINQAGNTLNSGNVSLSQNRIGERDRIVRFELPRKFERLALDTEMHETKFVPRGMEEYVVNGTTQQLDADLQPINGEVALDDQPYHSVVVYNVTDGSEITPASIDYATDTVELPSDPAGDTIKFYPVLTQGNIFYRVVDAFDTPVSTLDRFGTAIRVFSQLELNNKRTRPHLEGSAVIVGNEKLELMMDSPQKVVWQDADYPRGEYVSTLSQRVIVDTGE